MWLVVSVIVTQVVIFIALIVIFRRILSRNVVSATKHIDELNQEYSKREEEASKKLTEATKKAQEIVAKAVDEAQAKGEEVLKKAEKAKQDIVKQAHGQGETIMQQADKSRELLLSELDQRIDKEAINKASELIQRALPEELKLATHSQWVKDLIENGFEKIGDVKIVEGIKEIKVLSAFPLSESDRTRLSKKVNKLLGSNMGLKEEVDPKIVAGIVVEIGSLVLDGSLRNKILEQSSALDSAERGASER
jgi:F0F1-type ATP synthase delta subunit